MTLTACAVDDGFIPAAPTTAATLPRSAPSWPVNFEIYACSALDELTALTEEVDQVIKDAEQGTASFGEEATRAMDAPLRRVSDYVDRIPGWEPGTRLRDLLNAAVRHYRQGSSALRGVTSRESPLVVEATEALERGNGSVRKTRTAMDELEQATGFRC